jgi:hypothetical protein
MHKPGILSLLFQKNTSSNKIRAQFFTVKNESWIESWISTSADIHQKYVYCVWICIIRKDDLKNSEKLSEKKRQKPLVSH